MGRAATDLKVLIIEDSDDDLQLLLHALKSGGFNLQYRQAQTLEQLSQALIDQTWDVIISDFSLPSFDGLEALRFVREKNVRIPFLMVSGTIGEETAVNVMKAGAQDYIMKSNLLRLTPAIHRELADFEEKQRLERELQKKSDELKQAQKMEAVGRLAGGIAHDFNNFLGVLMLASENVQAKLSKSHSAWKDVDQIQTIVQKAASLTRQLLTFSRKQVSEPKSVDVNSMVNQTQKLLTSLLGEHIKLETSLSESLSHILIDPSQLEQILMNLIVNARDAMPAGGTIRVQTRLVTIKPSETFKFDDIKPGEYVLITVKDTGCGIDEKLKKLIFDPFFTTKDPDKGTGLGLSTVFGIVKQANGHISFESTLGKGTEFKVFFPAVKSIEAPAEVHPFPPILEGSETILLVEDQEELRTVIEESLLKHKYKVISCGSPKQAIETSKNYKNSIDLLLTDLVMPELNGFELAEALCNQRKGTKILVMSGYLDDKLLQSHFGKAPRTCIHKPFTSEELLRKVRQILDRQEPK